MMHLCSWRCLSAMEGGAEVRPKTDVFSLKKRDVKEGFIEVTTVKTADSLSAELNDVTRGILDRLIGAHMGRKIFIINALSFGAPPDVVMKWTGYSDCRAMKPCIDILDSVKADSMTKLNGLL